MRLLEFTFYFIKLRFKVLAGMHRTAKPLGIRWRWQHWKKLKGEY